MREPLLDEVGRSPSFMRGWWVIPTLFFGVALIASVYALLT